MTNTFETPLCALAYKYGSDECPQLKHTYTPFYYKLLKNRREKFKKVLEIGIGPYKARPKRYIGSGASLFMWRDFFPNATIFGADIHPPALIESDRIKTFLCDERAEDNLHKLIYLVGGDIDFVVDDASHTATDQIKTCQIIMPLLKRDVVYIIEDAVRSNKIVEALNIYNTTIPEIVNRSANNQIVMVKRK